MMAAANGIAARARAFAALPTQRAAGLLGLAAACLLAACGGGGGGATPDGSCASADGVRMPGAGNVVSLTVRNDGAQPRRVTLTGRVSFSGTGSGAAGGYSTLLVTDGQSPVQVGQVQAAAGGAAQGAQDLSVDVILPAGSVATWHLAHAPLPAPYSWASMVFGVADLCAK